MALRVIVGGTGVRGRDWIAELQRDAKFQAVACADPDAGTRTRSGIPAFATLEQALDSVQCEAVIVATPADLHEEACNLAIAAGKAVLVEKPFADSLAAAKRIVDAAETQRLPLIVAQNYRYLRVWRTVREVIAQGRLGNVRTIACHYYRPPHQMAPSLARLENSVLWGVAVHHLDALRHVLRRRIHGVFADTFTHGELPRGASMNALLSFEGGARATYTASYESSGHEFFERGQELYARFTGDRATLHVTHRWLFLCEGRKLPRPVRRGPRTMTEERVLLGQLEHAIRDGVDSECSGRENLQTMAAVEACARSANERRWIDPQELLA